MYNVVPLSMQARFFNDWGPRDRERLLIGFAIPETDIGQRREAVRVATADDVDRFPKAYQAYLDSFGAAAGEGSARPAAGA